MKTTNYCENLMDEPIKSYLNGNVTNGINNMIKNNKTMKKTLNQILEIGRCYYNPIYYLKKQINDNYVIVNDDGYYVYSSRKDYENCKTYIIKENKLIKYHINKIKPDISDIDVYCENMHNNNKMCLLYQSILFKKHTKIWIYIVI